ASTSACEVTSQRTACPPIAFAVALAAASSKSATTTFAPSAASRVAVAAPIPRAPPVTSAVFASNLTARPYTVRFVEFRDILARRGMPGGLEPTPIPQEQIERIVNVIRRAPSGGFTQGASIVVVTDEAKRGQFADAWADHPPTQVFVAQAPVLLVISANETLY